jgi:DNA-binding winged helix-turn-helix (wHTH) protein/Tol biopolymer transport system component
MLAAKSSVFRFADVTVREREFAIVKAGQILQVEPKAFRVLLILIRNPSKLISKEELLSAVWADAAVTENSLTRNIALLRRLLGDDPRDPQFIETVSSIGYRFVCPVEVSEETSGDPGGIRGADVTTPNGKAKTAANGESISEPDIPPPQASERKNSAFDAKRERTLFKWLLAAGVFVIATGAATWYLLRPLPPLRVVAYTQLTHDGAAKRNPRADGNRIVFTSYDKPGIAEVSVSGGETTNIPIALRDFVYLEDVSPDGFNFLAASGEEGIKAARPQWNVRMPGGPVRRLPNAVWGDFSPDGKQVAYTGEDGDLWLVGSDGSGAHKLASLGVVDHSFQGRPDGGAGGMATGPFAWSPDGNTIRFSKSGRLWEISLSGSNLHEVLPRWSTSSQQRSGGWTPDGRFFVFQTIPRGFYTPGEIWAIDERRGIFGRRRTNPVQLASGPIDWRYPVPSKDGKRIFASGRSYRGELSRFNAETRQFEPFLGGISAQGVSFSRDGKHVAYVSYPQGTLWKAERDGSHPLRLTDPPIEAIRPRWSPDGTQIIFTDLASNPVQAVYVVGADGGSPQPVLPGDKEFEGDPEWSADGRRIVLSSASPFLPEGSMRILDLTTHQVSVVPESIGMFSPRWSPDGRFIAAAVHDTGGLKLFNVTTQQWSTLMENESAAFPEWSKDSQSIYFISGQVNGSMGVYRVRITGGAPACVVSLKDFNITGWWHDWMGLDPTDAPLVLRDFGSDDIYALTLSQK